MTKREIIDRIGQLNPTARPDFLADFDADDLRAYLHQLTELQRAHEAEGVLEPVAGG